MKRMEKNNKRIQLLNQYSHQNQATSNDQYVIQGAAPIYSDLIVD